MKKFNPFGDYFYKTKIEILPQEKEQLRVFMDTLTPLFDPNKVAPVTSYTLQYILNMPLMSNLKKQVEGYLDEIGCVLGNSWGQKYIKNQSHGIHTHCNSVYSGIIYVEVTDSPTFFLHPYAGNIPNSPKFTYLYQNAEPNTMILFPSYTAHFVEKHTNNTERIVISFNAYDKVSGETKGAPKIGLKDGKD
tara:strand:+ start:13039 stop:13611 length:573 start_codon:yes stop_codon:yes gene_type:complete